jgi:predicted dehydrogenase
MCRDTPQVFEDHRELLASGLCDAVVIATPNFTHIDMMRDALALKDLHILVEKPLVTRMDDGVELMRAPKAAAASSGWRRNTATCRRWPR